MGFDVETTGFEETIQDLKSLERDLGQGGPWVVGSAVSYTVFVEFGTRYMDARPFFRPAIAEVRAQGVDGFIEDNTRKSMSDIEDVDELVRTLAFALESRIKRIITKKGLIDTGTMRASVKAVPGADVSQLPSADEVDASADVEVDA